MLIIDLLMDIYTWEKRQEKYGVQSSLVTLGYVTRTATVVSSTCYSSFVNDN